jgi:hypothetical protein
MEALIQHYFKSNHDEILSRSLINCHCKGLHSIMLSEIPERTIRLYITDQSHELWKNDEQQEQSLAYHPHHCDLTLHCIFGALVNAVVTESESGRDVSRYLYKSKISDGEMAFQYLGKSNISLPTPTVVGKGEYVFMKASDIHTVFCTKGTINAWLVYEGKEDPNYVPLCWTNRDLNNQTSEGLYEKPTLSKLKEILKSIHVTI